MSAPSDGPVAVAGGRTPQRGLGIAAVLLSATGMGTAGFLAREAQPGDEVVGPFLTFGRMAVGLVGFALLIGLTGRGPLLRRTRLSAPVVIGGLCAGVGLTAFLTATMLTSIARAVFLLYTGPLVATLLAVLIRRERLSPRQVVALGAVFVGMVLTIGLVTYVPGRGLRVLDAGAAGASGSTLTGDLLGIASGLLYGTALFCYRYRPDMPADVRSFWNFTFAAVGSGAVTLLDLPDLSGMTAANWGWAGLLFVLTGFVCLGLLVLAAQHLPTAELSALVYWECVIALIIGFLVYGEPLTPVATVGGLLIVLGGLGQLAPGRRAGAARARRGLAMPPPR